MSNTVRKLDKETRQELAREAIRATKEMGYCDEVRTVLENMGFDLEDETKTFTLDVTFVVPFGTTLEDLHFYVIAEGGDNYEEYTSDDVRIRS